jgi:magnesium-transporting ATPase (P-type)
MSVIVKDLATSKILLFTKGADSIITKLLSKGQIESFKIVDGFVREYALDGLRTLFLAKKEINVNDYEKIKNDFHKALTSVEYREQNVSQVCSEIEIDLELIGSSAIEDKL